MAQETRAERNIEWVEKNLFLPDGKYVGQCVKMADFMKDDFRAIYDNEVGTRRAIISRGRKNAKTVECAFILLLHLCGREKRLNSQLYSCAQSRDQAALLFDYAVKMIRLSPDLRAAVQIRDAAKEIICPELGTFFKALSAESTTAFGKNPSLCIFDELGQVRGPRSPLYEAMETATAAQEEPLTIVISTQAPTDNDLLSILIDDAKAEHDPKVVLRLNTAPVELDPFSEEAIRAANPAFDVFMNKAEVLAMAADAKRMPAREAEYQNLVTNRRVEASNPFVAPAVWATCGKREVPDLRGKRVYAGLDLSEVHDLTALVLIADVAGVWYVKPTFWLPEEGLLEKSRHDRVPYDMWRNQGWLETTPGKSVSYEYVAGRLRTIFDEHQVVKIGFDRWNMKHLKPWLEKAKFSEQLITDKFVEFGQGTQSMSPALRELESLVLDEKIQHGMHPVLQMCAVNSVVEGKDSANRKLSKNRSRGRIDGMVALAMAVGVAPTKVVAFDAKALIG